MGFRDTSIYRHVLSAVAHPRNFLLCLKYPFWKSRNVFSGKFCGYQSTMYDWIPDGWKKAFGKQLTEEIADALKADGIKRRDWAENLQFQDIKEKYGTLRIYATTTARVQWVFDKYECMSYGYCVNCGKPVRYITQGYVNLICDDCAHSGKYGGLFDRLTKEDAPAYYFYENGKETKATAKERYGIDLEALWGLSEEKDNNGKRN